MPSDFSVDLLDGIETLELLGNLGLSVVFALVLSYVVERHSRIIGDRSHYTVVLLALMPTMVLIITVVKSSLALSLGLVGALSIVRFRTPIKEPEELVYLFLAIAVGLGLGANQVIPTTLAFLFVIAVLVAADLLRRRQTTSAVFLDVDGPPAGDAIGVDALCSVLRQRNIPFELKRYNEGPEALSATFVVEASSTHDLDAVVADLRQKVSGGSVTIIDRSRQLN
jgi:hypothetical protein